MNDEKHAQKNFVNVKDKRHYVIKEWYFSKEKRKKNIIRIHIIFDVYKLGRKNDEKKKMYQVLIFILLKKKDE